MAGISGIGRTIENFQTTFGSGPTGQVGGETKIYARRATDTNENEARKGKKRPNEDHDHPKTKLKHMVSISFLIEFFRISLKLFLVLFSKFFQFLMVFKSLVAFIV